MMMRVVLLCIFLFLSLSSTIDAQESPSTCPPGVRTFMCFAVPCTVRTCKRGSEFCVNDYCGGCFAKCPCASNDECWDGQECQSGTCVSTATTTTAAPETSEVATTAPETTETTEVATSAAPSNCPSDIPTSECVCRHKNKFWAIGGFFDGCNSCQCTDDLRVICTQRICPIIPDDAPTDAPTTTPATTNSNNTCLITNDDYSMCQGGITPCSVVRCGTGPCVAHRCGENNQCKAVCSCTEDSNCLTPGSRCVANEFGIKTCQDIPTPTPSTCVITSDFSSCENGMNPCAAALCMAGTQCVAQKCDNNQCTAVCQPISSTAPPATSECPGKVCPAILCANRPVACTYGCGIDYCSCTDFCKCQSDRDCASGERCEGAAFGKDGKCVRRPRLLSQLDRF